MQVYEYLEQLAKEYEKELENTGFDNWKSYHEYLVGILYQKQGSNNYVDNLDEQQLEYIISIAKRKLEEKKQEEQVRVWSVDGDDIMFSRHFLSISEAYKFLNDRFTSCDWSADEEDNNYRCDWIVQSNLVPKSELHNYGIG